MYIQSTYQYILVCTVFSITYQYVLGTDRYIPVCTKNHDFVQPVTIPDAGSEHYTPLTPEIRVQAHSNSIASGGRFASTGIIQVYSRHITKLLGKNMRGIYLEYSRHKLEMTRKEYVTHILDIYLV